MDEKQESLADIVAEMRGMGNYQQYSGDHARQLADRIEEAWRCEREEWSSRLATPARNCDVGTAEEQCDRFLRFCQSRGCVNCEIGDGNRAKFPSCELVWAQMPYEEGGAV